TGTLQGTTSLTAVDGVVSYTDLSHIVATTISITFSGASLVSTTSTSIVVGPAVASTLGFATQPANATAGSIFGTQPVVQSQDAFGNNSSSGLPSSLPVTLSLTSGTGSLQGTASIDIGTGFGNGTATFSNLRIDAAGSSKQLTASASGLSGIASSNFTVNPATATVLVIQTQPPSSATAGTAFSPAPAVQLLDAFGNLVTTNSSTVVTATRNAGTAALQGTTTATAASGVA